MFIVNSHFILDLFFLKNAPQRFYPTPNYLSLARLPLHVEGHALPFETNKIDFTIVIKTYGNFL